MIFDTDDLHATNHRLDLLIRLREANPAFRMTAFAVPSLCPESFLEELPDWIEVAGHGWTHSCPREAEHWTREEATEVLLRLPQRFVRGWKSPGWQVSDGTYEALLDLDFWIADHPDNDARRPQSLRVHRVYDGDHIHTHVQDVCGNGIEETWDDLVERVSVAESFEWVSEVVTPWRVPVNA